MKNGQQETGNEKPVNVPQLDLLFGSPVSSFPFQVSGFIFSVNAAP
jgi:hypothetical protein